MTGSITMPYVVANGIRLAYQRSGQGEPVLLIMGSSAGGRVWTVHQTPALRRAGYEAITFDNRGIPPSDVPAGQYSLADMVADTCGLIEALGIGPCRIVGTSLGAWIAEELAVRHPGLVRAAVLVATRSRPDAFRSALVRADQVLEESGVDLPGPYDAAMWVLQMFSPATLRDDAAVTPLLELYDLSSAGRVRHGQAWVNRAEDRREALSGITVPCRVIAFADDVVTPPHLAREVADAIPECDLVEVADAGHLGFLEKPDEVNRAIVEFFEKY
jgi:pimeloyl-ACP methyl ester carboxylesterase